MTCVWEGGRGRCENGVCTVSLSSRLTTQTRTGHTYTNTHPASGARACSMRTCTTRGSTVLAVGTAASWCVACQITGETMGNSTCCIIPASPRTLQLWTGHTARSIHDKYTAHPHSTHTKDKGKGKTGRRWWRTSHMVSDSITSQQYVHSHSHRVCLLQPPDNHHSPPSERVSFTCDPLYRLALSPRACRSTDRNVLGVP